MPKAETASQAQDMDAAEEGIISVNARARPVLYGAMVIPTGINAWLESERRKGCVSKNPTGRSYEGDYTPAGTAGDPNAVRTIWCL